MPKATEGYGAGLFYRMWVDRVEPCTSDYFQGLGHFFDTNDRTYWRAKFWFPTRRYKSLFGVRNQMLIGIKPIIDVEFPEISWLEQYDPTTEVAW